MTFAQIKAVFIICLCSVLGSAFTIKAETVIDVADANFPDQAFQKYVKNNIDTNGDGVLQLSEREAVTSVSVDWGDYRIADYQGIEFFSNLQRLTISAAYYPSDEDFDASYQGDVIHMNLSQNKRLKSLSCTAEEVKGLDVTELSELEEITITADHEQLDLSKNTELRRISAKKVRLKGTLPRLEYLSVAEADMGEFDITASRQLESVYLRDVKMNALRLENMDKLKKIQCSGDVSELRLVNNKRLNCVSADGCKLKRLSLKKCGNLKSLTCFNNKLTELDVQKCHKLTSLNCSQNPLKSLRLSSKAVYERVQAYHCNLNSLKLRKSRIKELNCSYNRLRVLDVRGCAKLEKLDCSNNQLRTLDVKGCTSLYELTCNRNRLKQLNLQNCNKITCLSCSHNKLSRLNLKNVKKMKTLYCGWNRLIRLNVRQCKELTYFHCNNNKLKKLDLRSCQYLLEVYRYGNPISKKNLRLSNSTGAKWGLTIK